MLKDSLKDQIENLWNTGVGDANCIGLVMQLLDSGRVRIAEKGTDGRYLVDESVKKAILLYFRKTAPQVMSFGGAVCFDKVPLKTENWAEKEFLQAGFRAVPGAIIRYGAYIAKSVVVMQSFVNIGARVDEGTMLDTYSLVGSCAQIGKNCHISAGVNIGGVLEPLQATPVIIEDNCFIGAGSSIMEGVIVEEGAVISSGVSLTASTKIVDRATGSFTYGRIPAYSVIVPGALPSANGNVSISCAVIVKQCDAETRKKTSVNELLRA